MLGETEFEFIHRPDKVRFGYFHPSPVGERLMHLVTGTHIASIELGKLDRALDKAGVSESDRHLHLSSTEWLTAEADFAAAVDQEAALELELRGPDGAVIPTEDIGVRDTEYLLAAYADEEFDFDDDTVYDAELEAELEEDLQLMEESRRYGSAWSSSAADDETPLPRYQIQVHLFDDWVIP
jgi:hypothetical protein